MVGLTGMGIAVMFGMDILAMIAVILYRNSSKPKTPTATEKKDFLDKMLKSKKWALSTTTFTLIEELLFRGPIYIMVLLESPWPILVFAIIVDGILFGYMHFRETHSFPDIYFKFGIGIFLSWLVVGSGSLIPSILCHLFPNLIWMSLFRWADTE